MSDSKPRTDDVLERNVEQLMAQAHEPPRMNPEARARVLDALVARARSERAEAGDRTGRWAALGRRPAWSAGAVLAAGLAAATVAAVIGGGGASSDPSVHQPSAVETVRLADGSELIINQGARAVVTGDRRIRVDRGEVLLDVAKTGRRFVVDTPHGRIEVLGTRFLVDAEEDETRAAVVRGRVKVASGDRSVTLRAGDEGVMRAGAAPIRRRAPRLSHLASWSKLAERQVEKPEDGPARRGTLLARNPNWQDNEFPLPMRQLTVDVHVENQIARVALDQTFFNPKPQQLEGVYYLALPADASIYRQAMYVGGKRMESAVVDRGRAREIYDEIVYRRRDPALMEWLAGNLYKVRIFPLPGRTEKRIAFEYTQPLTRLYDDYRIEVPLPAIDRPVDDVTYRVRLVDCARCEIASTSHDLERAVDGDDLMLSLSRTNVDIGDDLVLTVRDPALRPRVARAEDGDARYLMVRAQPEIAPATAEPPPRRRRSWVVLHDTSASRSTLERKAQAFVIDRLLRQLDEEDDFQLLAFDAEIRALSPEPQQVADVDRRAVAQFLARESADGVGYTDLAAALRRAVELTGASDGAEPYVLYLGDGIVTAGERELDSLRRAVEGKATFVGVAVGERMDMNVLRELADVTGGMTAVMNPGDDLAWRSFDLVAALETPRVVDLSAVLVDERGTAIEGARLYPSARQLADGEELTLVGRLSGPRAAAVRLTGRRGGEPWSRDIALPEGAGDDAGYLPRIWAERRVDHLLRTEADGARDEIVRLGTEHFLVTPYTSLLVLENEAMYRQYGVEQVRDERWAMYQLPDEIEVVHEPAGAAGGPQSGVPTDAVLLRTPTQIFHSYGGSYDRGGLVFAEGESLNGLRVSGAMSGTGRGFGSGGGGSAPIGGTISLSTPIADTTLETAAVRESQPVSANDPAPGFLGGDGDVAAAHSQVIVTTDDLRRGGELNNEAVFRNRRGLRKAKKRASSRANAYERLSALKGRTRGPIASGKIGWVGGRDSSRFDGRYYYGHASPQPIALHYATDPRLDDLTEQIPGLFADDLDVELRALLDGAGATGSITDDARALVDAARARTAGRRFVADDDSEIEVDARGRMRLARTLPSGLGEEILFDGERVYHLYPQLGLAARRWAKNASPAVFARWLPLVIGDADGLARWYDVSRPEPGVLRLVRAGGKPADSAVELVFDDGHRLRELALVRGAEREVVLSASWSDDGVTVTQGGARQRLRLADAEPFEAVDEAAWTVVEMPLRQPIYWQEKLDGTTGAERRRIQRQLLVAWASVGNQQKLAEVARQMIDEAPLSRGELTLASGAARQIGNRTQLRAWIRGTGKGDPVASYVAASYQLARSPQGDAFERVARNQGGFVGALADYRAALVRVRDYNRSAASARKAARRYIADGGPAPFLYIVAHAFAQQHGWRSYESAVELWDAAAAAMDDPSWRQVARVESARWLYNRQQYDAAAERFDQILRTLPADRPMPVLDRIAQWAFNASARGQAGWKLFWGRWRDQALARGDAASLIALAQSATAVGMQRDLDRISARLIDIGAADPAAAAEIAGVLYSAGRAASALAVIEPHVAGGAADPDMLALASAIAEQQGRLADAADYFQRALDSYGDEPVTLATARQEFARMLGLLGRLAQTSAADDRAGYVDRALQVAADWRRADPDNDQIDTTVSRMLYGIGRTDEAWRYLTSAIERHPGEGSAYQSVATVLEEEGEVARAEELWRRAAELEPENPTWLLRRANALFALGDRDQAEKLVDRIADGDWHERFQNVKWQADRLRKQTR